MGMVCMYVDHQADVFSAITTVHEHQILILVVDLVVAVVSLFLKSHNFIYLVYEWMSHHKIIPIWPVITAQWPHHWYIILLPQLLACM